MEYILPIICSILLLSLIAALIFKNEFRRDLLATQGEANIFGVLTVKGVAIIILSGLFLGGLMWSLVNSNKYISTDLTVALSNNQISSINETKLKIDNIENQLLNFYTSEYIPASANNFASLMHSRKNPEIEEIIKESSAENVKSFSSAIKKLQELRDKCNSSIIQYYQQISEAMENGDKKYKEMIRKRPDMLTGLSKLEESINSISKSRNEKLNDYFYVINQYLTNINY